MLATENSRKTLKFIKYSFPQKFLFLKKGERDWIHMHLSFSPFLEIMWTELWQKLSSKKFLHYLVILNKVKMSPFINGDCYS